MRPPRKNKKRKKQKKSLNDKSKKSNNRIKGVPERERGYTRSERSEEIQVP